MKDDEEQITFCAGITLVEVQAKGNWTKFQEYQNCQYNSKIGTYGRICPTVTTDQYFQKVKTFLLVDKLKAKLTKCPAPHTA